MTDERWLSEYLLGEGSDNDRAIWQKRLDSDPALRARVEGLGDVVERLQQLPSSAWEQLGKSPAPAALDDPRPQKPLRRRRSVLGLPLQGIAALSAAAVFAAGIGLGELLRGGGAAVVLTPRATATLPLHPLAGTQPTATGVARLLSDGELQLSVRGLAATTTGHYYEAWLMTSTQRLISIASFQIDKRGQTRLTVHLPAAPSRYRYIDISLQNVADGAAHSQQSVLRGPTRT